MSGKDRKFKGFFRQKLRDLKKKKKKKKVFAKIQGDFSSKISQVQTFEGWLFSYGGGYFPFFTENRPEKHKKHAILHTSQPNGGARAPPPLATLLIVCIYNLHRTGALEEIRNEGAALEVWGQSPQPPEARGSGGGAPSD